MPAAFTALKPRDSSEELVRFWRSHRVTLLRICKRWSKGNAADAEDLLGEACLRALQSLSAAPTELERPLAWWATVIANVARDKARRWDRYSRVYADLPEAWRTRAALDLRPRLDEQLLLKAELEQVRCRMATLSGPQRLAITFRGFGDEYAEIAVKLGTSNTNARKLVQVGRRLLRDNRDQPTAGELSYS